MAMMEMHPALTAAIRAAEATYACCKEQDCSPADSYDHAWDDAFKVALQHGLPRDDAKVVATSAASDGNADPEEGYKDIIPPFTRTVRTVVQRKYDQRKNHQKKA
jgi:hypothetical protein